MAEKDAAGAAKTAGAAAAEAPKGNPVFRMMGLPNIRMKLPSRKWMIFLTITGSWTAAIVYDRQEKRRIQKKWCNLVSHLANEPLPSTSQPRKVTVYVSAPPADGLTSARDHFHDFVKPILVAAALDWDSVEGRREGDVRAGLAERIRKQRKIKGETSSEPLTESDHDVVLAAMRERMGIHPVSEVAGDIVIGRHTWKEYIRGLHEGWLGPLDPPPAPPAPSVEPAPASDAASESKSADDASPTEGSDPPPAVEEPPKESTESTDASKPKKRKQPPPFNKTSDYAESQLSWHCPSELPPSVAIAHPHLLGFFNTPIRVVRFINKRKLADDIGRQTAAAIFALYQPYESSAQQLSLDSPTSLDTGDQATESEGATWEQARLLKHEEPEWHKSIRKEAAEGGETHADGKERIWTSNVVIDDRIAERMRKFQMTQEFEERAKEIEKNLRPWYFFGYGEKEANDDSE